MFQRSLSLHTAIIMPYILALQMHNYNTDSVQLYCTLQLFPLISEIKMAPITIKWELIFSEF